MQKTRFKFYLTEVWLILFILLSCYAYWLFWSVGDAALTAWYLPQTLDELTQSSHYWKIISPVFIHFTEFHLITNLALWWFYGRIIGSVAPGWLILLTCSSGILGNLIQWWSGGHLFGGMSGVVSCLIGFFAINEFLRRETVFFINRVDVFVFLGYLALVATGFFGVYSNAAHFVGLFSGTLIGLVFIKLHPVVVKEKKDSSQEASKDNN